MQFIKPNFEILPQGEGLNGIYRQIEIAGRTCYKSADKATENSSEVFTQRMVESSHTAMCEHATIYLFIPFVAGNELYYVAEKYRNNKFSYIKIRNKHFCLDKNGYYITTNYRVLVENDWLDDLKYMTEPKEYHEKRITVRFHMDRIGTQSCTRHRPMSFAQESTRYVNYSKDKFGSEINISIPTWTNEKEIQESYENKDYMLDVYYNFLNEKYNETSPQGRNPINTIFYWLAANEFAEWSYMKLVECGLRAEQARCVLPVGVDSEIIITGSIKDWTHFFNLRHFGTTGKPHPDIQEIATGLYNEFIKLGYIKEKETDN